MEYTGERMVPEATDGLTFWEHVERYRFALQHVAGRRVLDIACGEGYGTAAIASVGATSVIGVDIAAEACEHAHAKYGVETRVGSAETMPLSDGEVDVVVSFETIEHLHDVKAFIRESHRVLSPGGRLIISTPNLPVYHERAPDNPFHHHEMDFEEFHRLLGMGFTEVTFYGQHIPLPKFWRLRGVRRLTSLYHRFVAPHVGRAPSPEVVVDVVSTIRRPLSWRDAFDPYHVRLMPISKLQRATYLIAVATRKEEFVDV
jgi:SAM-dependent methyltransferase